MKHFAIHMGNMLRNTDVAQHIPMCMASFTPEIPSCCVDSSPGECLCASSATSQETGGTVAA